MTANELKQRQARSESLRVIQVDEDQFWVESSEGKICYRVLFEGEKVSCTCGDYIRGIKADGNFRCKHVISVFNSVPAGDVKNGKLLERGKPKLDERFIISIDGHDFVKYQGLLDLGHQKGISQIEVDAVQLPTSENGNFAICKATVVSKNGESFTDLGDATPQNCNVKVSKHLLRLASTRAIARALRSFTNVGLTAIEELADLNDIAGNGSDGKRPKIVRNAGSHGSQLKTVKKPESAPEKPAEARDENQKGQIRTDKSDNSDGQKAKGNGSGKSQPAETKPPKDPVPADSKTETKIPEKQTAQPMMSEAQKRAIYNLSRRRGVSVEALERMAFEAYAVELEHLSSRDASSFIRNLQQAS